MNNTIASSSVSFVANLPDLNLHDLIEYSNSSIFSKVLLQDKNS